MAYERMANGVKRRSDEAGDAWAKVHRRLGPGFQMQDIDATFGFQAFGANTAERLFMEYEPDEYANRTEMVRRFALIALFDRKQTLGAARAAENTVSLAFYLFLCRTCAAVQPVAPRFFFVIGGQSPPWMMQEISIYSGMNCPGDPIKITDIDIAEVWNTLGLSTLRRQLRQWITAKE